MNNKEKRDKVISRVKNSLSKIPLISRNVVMARLKLHTTAHEPKLDQNSTSSICTNDDFIHEEKSNPVAMDAFENLYEMGNKIGEGSNGVVRQCLNLKKNKIYACKSFMFDDQNIPYIKKTFILVRGLNNPYFVRYKSLYIDSEKHLAYLIMEKIDLPNLSAFIHTKKEQILEEELNWIFKEIFKAVSLMHRKGICHRDLKPENIMIDALNKKIKILDFGVCKKMIRRKQKMDMLTITGTLFYRAPETFKGGSYDEKVDTWSIGVTLFKIITGKTPFESHYIAEAISNIQKMPLQLQKQKKFGKLSFLLRDFLQRLLKKNPCDRLSAKQALQHLWFKNMELKSQKRRFSQNLHHVQTEYSKLLLPKIKELDPKLFSFNQSCEKNDGNIFYRIETEEI